MFTNKELGVISDLFDTFVSDQDEDDLKDNLGIDLDEYRELVTKVRDSYHKPVLTLFDGLIELRMSTNGDQVFQLVYGKQTTYGDYQKIASELGFSIFHHLTNEGLMD